MLSLNDEQQQKLAKAELLYSLEDIDKALDQIAQKLNERFSGETLTVLCVMNGGLVTAGQLLPKLNFQLSMDYIHASRYHHRTRGRETLEWHHFPNQDLNHQKVLIIDDIFDEGITLEAIKKYCEAQGAQEVFSFVLVQKEHERKATDFQPDYSALSVPDHYVFGFGMDYLGYMRNAAGIFSIK